VASVDLASSSAPVSAVEAAAFGAAAPVFALEEEACAVVADAQGAAAPVAVAAEEARSESVRADYFRAEPVRGDYFVAPPEADFPAVRADCSAARLGVDCPAGLRPVTGRVADSAAGG
jgi:hypothetical protein